MRRGRCKPRFHAPGRNVGQHRAVSGRFRRPPDAPNWPLQAAILDAQERVKGPLDTAHLVCAGEEGMLRFLIAAIYCSCGPLSF